MHGDLLSSLSVPRSPWWKTAQPGRFLLAVRWSAIPPGYFCDLALPAYQTKC